AVRQHPERARTDPALIEAVLREALLCHVAFVADGLPYVIPTTYVPFDGGICLHGAANGRMVTTAGSGVPISICITLLDGLVLARSAMNHSMNYRCVMIFGAGLPIVDRARKRAVLDALVEHAIPGRSPFVRPPTDSELDRTGVVWFSLDACSAKTRSGPSVDSVGDRAAPTWAGTLPLHIVAGRPVTDCGEAPPASPEQAVVPDHIVGWSRGRAVQ
ncbi:MAG: pyridoxamine 5'-phosphate oxidase family protein, partial [Planctomycetes bacterium]|nr:pyridoxamine 5'-phosphate oxidase family protein [Planctomycetota bacterium]